MRRDRGAAREPANGRLFAMVARRKPDIYRKANYPDANNRPIATIPRRPLSGDSRLIASKTRSADDQLL